MLVFFGLKDLIIGLKIYGIMATLGYYRIYTNISTKKQLLLVIDSIIWY